MEGTWFMGTYDPGQFSAANPMNVRDARATLELH